MKPFLGKEMLIANLYLKSNPINMGEMASLLMALAALKDAEWCPYDLTVNQFRALLGAQPHPDDRGEAKLFAPDEWRAGDDAPSADELKALWAAKVADNQGPFERGELQTRFPELAEAAKNEIN